jgi:hypothetical protein
MNENLEKNANLQNETKADKVLKLINQGELILERLDRFVIRLTAFILTLIGIFALLLGKC